MYRDRYCNIVSTDISEVVVERMQQKAASNGCEGIRWQVADMLNLPFTDGQFDVVIEKGAMDVLFVDSDSHWDPSEPVVARVRAMLTSVHRVLAPHGLFVSITFGQPHFRRRLFESPAYSWVTAYSTFGETFHYFFYTLRKGTQKAGTTEGDCEPKQSFEPKLDMMHETMDDPDSLMLIQVDDEGD
ncbi:S-adenosyl-L-methionine dependent methyltransferases [Klebsormidium nitens]|uniref:S-adenosyl-L-methionine dependent methyltransferases n=1 Tax=Klebsormidium nitens TaxID=105231 RepID=A0A1Y1I9T5_KLENI|nr:S-adenosyl-L-methionine dependent methyltransferases [Klebsormidium nitens]|eukprot:GAQ87323.1 S-adenosyl-L-methionine dependent methyltransferases [Klebsormidium nitens]